VAAVSSAIRVLIVDDDPMVRSGLRLMLERDDTVTVAVLVLTTFDADELVLRALQAGAAGFLLKHAIPAEIVRAIQLVHAGQSVLSPTITRRMIDLVAGSGEEGMRRDDACARLSRLSPRELEVAYAVAGGLANPDIASELHMSVGTVKAHVTKVFAKLDVDNRVQISLLVQHAGSVAP
jgi:DNA-binding NarL/FixJ family response regulator